MSGAVSPPTPRIRIVLVDDSELVRMGLRAVLGTERTLEIVGEGSSVATGVAACAKHKPDVALLDLRLPDGTGFDACREILRRLPETRVLMLTSVADDTLVDEAIRAGAHGYLLKEVNSRGLIQAITDVAAGKSILDPAVTARVMQFMKAGGPTRDVLASLSPQESRVLALIAQGKTNKEAGNEMNLTEKTVKNYLSNIFEKLHVSRRAQAAAIYAEQRK